MRVQTLLPHQSELPLIIFSGANAPNKIDALRARQVEALMASFEYIRGAKKTRRAPNEQYDWPTRRYLDSGVFTILRRGEGSRITIHDAIKDAENHSKERLWQEYKRLVSDYASYLRTNHTEWDHIAELDVDTMFGPEVTWAARKHLRTIVGDKLLPVWHAVAGYDSWDDMIRTYPYVAVGSDAAAKSNGSSKRPLIPRSELRALVQKAHAAGVLVHGMGDTKANTFSEIGWDSADSTTWISGSRFGQYAGIRHSPKHSHHTTAFDISRSRVLEDYVEANGYSREIFHEHGETTGKLQIAILLLQRREAMARASRQGALRPSLELFDYEQTSLDEALEEMDSERVTA